MTKTSASIGWPRHFALAIVFLALSTQSFARDLPQVLESGVLRHLGVPYANFVTGAGDGLDVELMQGFAAYLGVRYEYVKTDWKHAIGDLTGRHVRRGENGAELLEETPVRADVLASGVTMLDWRKEVVEFSDPTFPTAVWLLARTDSSLQPIEPTGSLQADIQVVKSNMADRSVLGLLGTCLDPALYKLDETKADIRLLAKVRKLNEMVPAILNRDAEATLLDVPDAMIALDRWPGAVKVIGPISENQSMGVVFPKTSPLLRAAFNRYYRQRRSNGNYASLITKYYPSIFQYYPNFFEDLGFTRVAHLD